MKKSVICMVVAMAGGTQVANADLLSGVVKSVAQQAVNGAVGAQQPPPPPAQYPNQQYPNQYQGYPPPGVQQPQAQYPNQPYPNQYQGYPPSAAGQQYQQPAQQQGYGQPANANAIVQGVAAAQSLRGLSSGGASFVGANAALGAAANMLNGAQNQPAPQATSPQQNLMQQFPNGMIGDYNQDGQLTQQEADWYRQAMAAGSAPVAQPVQAQPAGAAGAIGNLLGGVLGR